MAVFVALLRAVNVGGTGILPMSDLRKLCQDCGFERVATYIQSGNVVFYSKLRAAQVQKQLEQALAKTLGKPVGVLLRTAAELEAIIEQNPFPRAAPNRLVVFFLDRPPAKDALDDLEIPGREEVELSGRELYVHYPDGQGRSKLKLPFAKTGTGRNLNTVQKLAALAREVEGG